jgi:hypothetical protein
VRFFFVLSFFLNSFYLAMHGSNRHDRSSHGDSADPFENIFCIACAPPTLLEMRTNIFTSLTRVPANDRNTGASFTIVAHETGAARRPPNKHDINIYLSQPGTVTLTATHTVRVVVVRVTVIFFGKSL